MESDEITVITAERVVTRAGGGVRNFPVAQLAESVKSFVRSISAVIEQTPSNIGAFELTELTLAAEISGQGKLVLLGTGVEASTKGGVTLKFERKKAPAVEVAATGV
jgi:hypothetical protein